MGISKRRRVVSAFGTILFFPAVCGVIFGLVKDPEQIVRENAHAVQLAVEGFAADNDGEYPVGWEDVSQKGIEFQDYLENFGGMPENPYEAGSDAIVFDAVPRAGEVAIEVSGLWNDKFVIRYADRDGVIHQYFSK